MYKSMFKQIMEAEQAGVSSTHYDYYSNEYLGSYEDEYDDYGYDYEDEYGYDDEASIKAMFNVMMKHPGLEKDIGKVEKLDRFMMRNLKANNNVMTDHTGKLITLNQKDIKKLRRAKTTDDYLNLVNMIRHRDNLIDTVNNQYKITRRSQNKLSAKWRKDAKLALKNRTIHPMGVLVDKAAKISKRHNSPRIANTLDNLATKLHNREYSEKLKLADFVKNEPGRLKRGALNKIK